MEYDKKVFWQYIYHDQLHPRNWIKSSVFYEYLLMFLVLYAVLFSELTLQRKGIMFMAFLVGISIIKIYAIYKSGYHRYWNKKQHGIPTRNDIKRMKEEHKAKAENPSAEKNESWKDEKHTQNEENPKTQTD